MAFILILAAVPVLSLDTVYSEQNNSSRGIVLQEISPELKLMMENDALEFYMDEATTQFAVKNKKDGSVFLSNPLDWETNGSIQDEDLQSEIGSLFTISYFDDESKAFTMSSYKNSVLLHQYTVHKPENGARTLSVDFLVGTDPNSDLVPEVLSVETFEEYILNSPKLTEEEKADIKKNYRLISDQEIEKLRAQSDRDILRAAYPNISTIPVYEIRKTVTNRKKVALNQYLAKTDLTLDIITADQEKVAASKDTTKEPAFNITVEFSLDQENLVVRIPKASFASPKKFHMTNIELLKYFGSIQGGEPGEIFMPDGSGAIMDTMTKRIQGMSSLALTLYGYDASKDTSIMTNRSSVLANECLLPVFGVTSENNALFGIIEGGISSAVLKADTATVEMPYNTARPDFIVLSSDVINYGNRRDRQFSNIYPQKTMGEDIQIRYAFLAKDSKSYVGMAKYYRSYLEKKGEIKRLPNDTRYPFFVELIGDIQKVKSYFGFRVNADQKLTTYEQAGRIAESLLKDGVASLSVKYLGWCNDGYFSSYNKTLKPIAVLGGKKDFTSLVRKMDEMGVAFYPDIDLLTVGKNKLFDGFNPNVQASRTVLQKAAEDTILHPVFQIPYADSMLQISLLSPAVTGKTLKGAVASAGKFGIKAVSLGDFGKKVHSDFRKNAEITRDRAVAIAKENYQYLKDQGYKVLIKGGAADYLKYADMIAGMPLSDSYFKSTDYSVPFTQIVLHGYINYAGESYNLSGDLSRCLLETAETGSALGYTWIAEPDSSMRDSFLQNIYTGINYRSGYDEAVKNYKKLQACLEKLQPLTIENHQRLGQVTVTTYEDGSRVCVNYGNTPETFMGTEIPAKDFILVKGGGKQ